MVDGDHGRPRDAGSPRAEEKAKGKRQKAKGKSAGDDSRAVPIPDF
jgi:hypothetical protein